jgi:DNA helicase II / ATP-dependent DNA helicase PcrA
MNLLEGLNESQRQAVLHKEGPAMIIAGAGSGKTRVLTMRIAHLIQNGVDPFRILSLTFTNKAAREMRNRIEKQIGSEARNIWMGTFHSVFAKILRREADRLGYPNNFTVYDADDAKSLIKNILKELNQDDKVYKPGLVLSRISAAKNRLIGVEQYNANPYYIADDSASNMPLIGQIYKIYQQRLFKSGSMDFDDLLFNTDKLFKEHPDVLNKYQNTFMYVMVDEYQDTNFCQYSITKKLSAVHNNIVVVGDDAQSIYAFRGADIQNILNFEKDYPDLEVFKLEQNYRSTNNIVQAANSIIKHNTAQLKKNVWTDNEHGELIELLKASSDNEEGRLIANSIFEEKMQFKVPNKHFAILYRTNAQSRSIEEALRKLNIRYKIIGGMSFYQRKEIKDLIAYMRLSVNPNDEQALRRVINYPKRGIGDTAVSKMLILAEENGVNLWDIVSNIQQLKAGRLGPAVEDFANLIKSFIIYKDTKDAFEAARYMADKSGLLRDLHDDKTVEGLARVENIQQLLNAVKEYIDNPETEDKSLSGFLQEVSLLTDADNKDNDDDVVTLMTIHMAKGLEFRNVYIVGMEEDLFPSQMMNTREDLEEERRLFYVAITRAEKKLTLSFATTRYQWGRLKTCEPSRFLKEIEPKFLKMAKPTQVEPVFSFSQNAPQTSHKMMFQPKTTVAPKVTYQPSPDFKPSDPALLQEGQKVEHPKFGFGTLLKLDTSGNDKKAIINFDMVGEKTLLLAFAKLKIHNN